MDQLNEAAAQASSPRPPIVIVPYQADWPAEFAALALRIDHIGSTSVPGLAAKDVIDIQVTVKALEPPVAHALEAAGYRRREPIRMDHVPRGQPETESEWSKWLYRPAAGQRSANVHIRVAGQLNQRYPLLFRDYLRAHPDAAEHYAIVTMALARRHANDVDAYYDVKDPVCDIIMIGAEAWAAATQWQPGSADA